MDSQLLPFATQDVPRYTSYPTAVQFQSPFPGQTSDDWLAALDPEATLSVYVHIPFCRQLCWYCGCNTAAANRSGRLSSYLESLHREIQLVAKLLPANTRVRRIAFGGGSPNARVDFGAHRHDLPSGSGPCACALGQIRLMPAGSDYRHQESLPFVVP